MIHLICAKSLPLGSLVRTSKARLIHLPQCMTSIRYASGESTGPKQTCLHKFHRDRSARMENFAGYSMPIVYKNQSIKLEHMQCRESAAAFDVSHMMQTVIRGRDMIKFMEKILTADIEGLNINKCALSVFTNETGGIIDDCIVGRCQDHIQLVSNAGNAETVWNWLNKAQKDLKLSVDIERLYDRGLIALQGPKAADVLEQLSGSKLDQYKFMTVFELNIKTIGNCNVTRCGYTGEDGFEISVLPDAAYALMDIICKNDLVKPAGLGARDTLRLEAGLCLHGHDISNETTPVEAALAWVVHKRRRVVGSFPGAARILDQLNCGTSLKRIGLVAKIEGGPPAREGSEVFNDDGSPLGKVTSGNFAPVLNRNIAMAYLPSELVKQQGKSILCRVRGKDIAYQVARMPFVSTHYYM